MITLLKNDKVTSKQQHKKAETDPKIQRTNWALPEECKEVGRWGGGRQNVTDSYLRNK